MGIILHLEVIEFGNEEKMSYINFLNKDRNYINCMDYFEKCMNYQLLRVF
jgi:hypothetical protein